MSKAAVLFTSVAGTILILIASFVWTPALRNNPALFLAFSAIAFGCVLFLYAFGEGRTWYVITSSQLVLQSMIFLLGRYLIFDSSFSLHILSLPLAAAVTVLLLYFEDTSKKVLPKLSAVLAGAYLLLVLFTGHFSFRAIISAVSEISSEYFQLIVMASLLGIFWYFISERQKEDEPEYYEEEIEESEQSEALNTAETEEVDTAPSSGQNLNNNRPYLPMTNAEVVQGSIAIQENNTQKDTLDTAVQAIHSINNHDDKATVKPETENFTENTIPDEHLRFIPGNSDDNIKKGETPNKDISPD